MAIFHEDIANIELNNGSIHRSFLHHSIGSGDNQANRFGVRVFRNGQPENIGGTVSGYFMRADGETVVISTGTVAGNVAYVTLPEACYAIEGQFALAIKCQGGGITGTMRIVDGIVSRTSTDIPVDPGQIIPSIDDLIDAINEAVESIPQDYSAMSNRVKKTIPAITKIKDSTLFENGSLDDEGEDDSYLMNFRCRTIALRALKPIQIKTLDEDSKFMIHVFDESGDFVSKTNWIESFETIPADTCFRLLLWVDTDTPLTAEEIYNHFDFVDGDESYEYEHGSILNGENDNSFRYYSRARNTRIKYAEDPINVAVKKASAAIVLVLYNSDGSYRSASSWNRQIIKIQAGSYYRLLMDADYDGTGKSYYSIEEIVSSFEFTTGEYINITEYIGTTQMKRLFIRGTALNDKTVSDWHKASRICTPALFECDDDLMIENDDGQISIAVFNRDSGELDYERYWPASVYVKARTPFACTLTKDSESDDPETTDQILNDVTFKRITNNISGLSPNIIWQCRNVDTYIYPMYSKWYIQAAAHNQYDRVRVNIRNTTDGNFVLIHDNTINNLARNPDGTRIEETVYSDGHTLAELNAYDWGIQYGPMYAGYGVPVLEDACKYAAMFNLGLTIETYQTTQTDIDNIYKIISKYGLMENLIVIPAGQNETYIQALEYWKTKNQYISYFFMLENNMTQAKIDLFNSFKTGKNNVYVSAPVWGTVPTEEQRLLAASNSWRLYSSAAMNFDELINLVGVNTGHTLIEANNVYMIKETMRKYADSQV